MKRDMSRLVKVPEGVEVIKNGDILTVKSDKGTLERKFADHLIDFNVSGGNVTITAKKGTKREKMRIGTFVSHIRNMVRGVKTPFTYKLKICAGHFPMNVSLQNNEISVKNFLGEKIPRKLALDTEVDIKIEGNEIRVSHINRERAGNTAASIEQLTKIKGRDLRIFQDGIYITEKPKKLLGK